MNTSPHILVVDDHPQVRRLYRLWLERAGYIVYEAPEGTEALEICRRTPITLVITDWEMPGMDGQELVRHLAALRPSPPVLVVSSRTDLPRHCYSLVKPVRSTALLAAVAEILNSRQGLPASI